MYLNFTVIDSNMCHRYVYQGMQYRPDWYFLLSYISVVFQVYCQQLFKPAQMWLLCYSSCHVPELKHSTGPAHPPEQPLGTTLQPVWCGVLVGIHSHSGGLICGSFHTSPKHTPSDHHSHYEWHRVLVPATPARRCVWGAPVQPSCSCPTPSACPAAGPAAQPLCGHSPAAGSPGTHSQPNLTAGGPCAPVPIPAAQRYHSPYLSRLLGQQCEQWPTCGGTRHPAPGRGPIWCGMGGQGQATEHQSIPGYHHHRHCHQGFWGQLVGPTACGTFIQQTGNRKTTPFTFSFLLHPVFDQVVDPICARSPGLSQSKKPPWMWWCGGGGHSQTRVRRIVFSLF